MKKWLLSLVLLLFEWPAVMAQVRLDVNDSGIALRKYYLSLDVDHLWIKGHHVNWETGEPDDPDAEHNIKTHCSVFVAAALKRKSIYILRPPDHIQSLLANAQFDWLQTRDAETKGWHEITGTETIAIYDSAQAMANRGMVVVAIYKNPDPHKSGHSALVMPLAITTAAIESDGPDLIMAGHFNSSNTPLKKGFKKHIQQWPDPAIRFYCYRP